MKKKWFALVMCLLLLTGMAMPAVEAAEALSSGGTHAYADGLYRIRHMDSNLYFSLDRGIQPYTNAEDQNYILVYHEDDGCYTISKASSVTNSLQSVYTSSQNKITTTWSGESYSMSSIRWKIEQNSYGRAQLIPKGGDVALVTENSGVSAGTSIVHGSQSASSSYWILEALVQPQTVANGSHRLINYYKANSYDDYVCLGYESSTAAKIVDAFSMDGLLNFTYNSDGYYTIVSKGMNLTYNPSTGKAVFQNSTGADNQRWMLYKTNNAYYIAPKSDLLKTLVASDSVADEGDTVELYSIASSRAGSSGSWAVDYLLPNGVYDFKHQLNIYVTTGDIDYAKPDTDVMLEGGGNGGSNTNSNCRWRLTYKGAGYYTISPSYNPVNELYMTYTSGGVELQPYNGSADQLWQIRYESGYNFFPKSNPGVSWNYYQGTSLPCKLNCAGEFVSGYKWTVRSLTEHRPLADGVYEFSQSNLYLTADGTAVKGGAASGGENYLAGWKLTYQMDGSYAVEPAYNPTAGLLTYAASEEPVCIAPSTGSSTQRWVIHETDDGRYTVQTKMNNSYLYMQNANNVVMSSTLRKWDIEKRQNLRPLNDGNYSFNAFSSSSDQTLASNGNGLVVVGDSEEGWSLQFADDGYYTLSLTEQSGQYMTYNSAQSRIDLQAYAGADTQKWRIGQSADGSLLISPKGRPDLYVCYSGSAVTFTDSASAAALWHANIYEVTYLISGVYDFKSVDNTYLTMSGGTVSAGADSGAESDYAKWQVTRQEDGSYTIAPADMTFLYLSYENGNLSFNTQQTSPAIRWNITAMGDGVYRIQAPSYGLYLGLTSAGGHRPDFRTEYR